MNNQKAGFLLSGIVAVVLGYMLVITGFDYLHGFPVPRLAGVLSMLMGVAFIIYGLRSGLDTTFMICPECKEVYGRRKARDLRCPRCGTSLEPLDGFYERHPNLKKRSDQEPGHKND